MDQNVRSIGHKLISLTGKRGKFFFFGQLLFYMYLTGSMSRVIYVDTDIRQRYTVDHQKDRSHQCFYYHQRMYKECRNVIDFEDHPICAEFAEGIESCKRYLETLMEPVDRMAIPYEQPLPDVFRDDNEELLG